MNALYPTRQPITTSSIEAWIAERIARRDANGAARLAARTRIRLTKLTPSAEAAMVDLMAHDMRMFGDGMTDNDLRLSGYSDDVIKLCAAKASAKALERAQLQ